MLRYNQPAFRYHMRHEKTHPIWVRFFHWRQKPIFHSIPICHNHFPIAHRIEFHKIDRLPFAEHHLSILDRNV